MSMRFLRHALAAAFVATIGGAGASAATIGFDLSIDGSARSNIGSTNVPLVTITNTGEADLTGFRLSIGDTAFNYDGIINLTAPLGVTATLLIGDTGIFGTDGRNTDELEFAFEGFGSGLSVSFNVDVDADNGSVRQDFRRILFNNDTAPNAVVTATFGALSLTDTLDDQPAGSGIALLSVSAPPGFNAADAAVPLPATLPLALAALGGLCFVGRRRRV